jgi:hypothetical protein
VRLESWWEILKNRGGGRVVREFEGLIPGKDVMNEIVLSEEQELEAAHIEDILRAKAAVEVRQIARLLASKENRELLGATEFRIRDAVHRVGAAGIDAALSERKKRGTRGRAGCARAAEATPASRATGIAGS